MARRLTLLTITVLITFIALLEIASGDAPAPGWMRPVVEDGRASLYQNIDVIGPGSPLIFTHARCRADGAMLLFYANRWLWVSPSYFVVDVPATWERQSEPRSFGGGVLEAMTIEYGNDLSEYFERAGEVACPPVRDAGDLAPAT
jgi:hypothetical protein